MFDIPIDEALKVDRFRLEIAASRHAGIYQYFSEHDANARKEKDALEDALSYLLATKELDFRKNPPQGVKITEGTIKALLEADEDVQKAKAKVRKAKADSYDLTAILRSLDHKKDQLRNLTNLFTAGYFAQKESTSSEFDEMTEEAARHKMVKKLKQRRDK